MKHFLAPPKKSSLLAYSIAVGLAMFGSAHAVPLMFSSTGGGAAAAKAIGSLDVPATGFVAVGGQTAIAKGVGATFQVLTMAAINRIADINNVVIPGSLNSSFELTLIAGVTERITSISATGISFVVEGPAFFRLYYDTTPDKNYLTGYGFNDGRLIASSNSVQNGAGGSFNLVGATTPVLDNFSGNSYPTQLTRVGIGSPVAINFYDFTADPAFFTNVAGNRLNIKIAGLSATLPFNSIDPPDCFTQTPDSSIAVGSSTPAVYTYACDNVHNNAGPYSAQGSPADANGVVPNTGLVNGLFSGSPVGRVDFVAQTDPILSADVPEPASILLAGAGLCALALVRRRRVRNSI